jgi:hypothetical protein
MLGGHATSKAKAHAAELLAEAAACDSRRPEVRSDTKGDSKRARLRA